MYNIHHCYFFANFRHELVRMAPYKRILVHLQHSPGAAPVLANFTECILDSFNFKNNSGNVSVELKDDNLILSPATTSPVVLTHPSFCPIHCLTPTAAESLAIETRQRGVDVGVVIVLETSDTKVLVTRRAKHMRTFPGTWVPPGGHVESGEKLLEAGLRELGEETGLVLPPDSVQGSRVLALWESVYPYSLGMGPPKRHHIVLYYWVRTCETSCELQTRLQLDASEVDAAMWLTPSLAKLVASGEVSEGSQRKG